MIIDIITLFPFFWKKIFLYYPIINKYLKKKIININIYNLKKYGIGKNKKIDDYPYGGGYGMILKIEPIYRYINKLKKKKKYNNILYLTPDSKLFNQKIAKKLSKKKKILFISGYYKGIDQRIRNKFITNEYSIGKYILSNGEIPILIIIDTILRLINNYKKSIITDTFYVSNRKYEYPLYTRPYKYKNIAVPKILLSGNHKKIKKWREKKIKNKKKGTK
ncbi:MAG: tRNA (guanosine(37)-N1)-methyltransferase TrmD [Candidatus Shikimatogenerans bostrichidophilus]|nr:MAG: tRNA (guanosine(37)-N1)-methyltransferase TrmD [Candidatus Shikimatogenerans bostrichidophilus]